MSLKPTSLPDDPIALKALVVQLQAQNTALSATVRALEQRIAKLKRQALGKASEKVERRIEQLELVLEDLLIAKTISSRGEEEVAPEPVKADAATLRERRGFAPVAACSDCGAQLRRVGEDVSAVLDMIVAQLKVVEIARVKKSCHACDAMV